MKKKLKSLGLILLAFSLAVIPVNAEPGVDSLKNEKQQILNEISKLEVEVVMIPFKFRFLCLI